MLLIFTNSIQTINEQLVDLAKVAIDTKNINLFKVVAYRNSTREAINNFIHNSIFADPNYQEGELIIFNDSYGESIENATEAQVSEVVERFVNEEGLNVSILRIVSNGAFETIKVVDRQDKAKLTTIVSKLFADAKALKSKDRGAYITALNKAWGYKKSFADIDFSYAITSHKSQGSTYDIVIVDEKDIASIGPISNTAKAQSVYTGLTRARNVSLVISSVNIDEKPMESLLTLNNIIEENKKGNNPIVLKPSIENLPEPGTATEEFLSLDSNVSDLSSS